MPVTAVMLEGQRLMTLTRSALLLAAAATLAPWGGTQAQTLQEALANAYANNPTLLTARAQLRVVDENVPQALAGWRPTVSITSSAGVLDAHSRSRTLNGRGEQLGIYSHLERQTMSHAVTATQPIFRGGRTVASTRRAENQVFAQRARLLATEQQVMNDGANAYVAVIRDAELVRLNTNNEQVLSEQLRATNERFRVGEITRTDVAQAESRLALARSQRAQAEGNLQASRAVFVRVLGLAPQRLAAPQPLRAPVRTQQEATQVAAANNPAVVAALFDEAAGRDFINVQMAQLLPQASIQAQGFRNDNPTLPHTRLTGAQITANVTVPIYQGGAEHSQVRQARQDAQRLRAVVDDQRNTAIQQAAQAWETLASTRAQADAVRAQIRAAEIALDGVQREAIVGSRTTLDVLNAEQELLNARTSLVQSLASVVNASYALAAALGRLTAQDLRLPVQAYDMRAYYNAVRDRWVGLGDYSNVATGR